MTRRASSALALLGLAVAGYLAGLWAIHEFHGSDDRPAEIRLESLLDARLSGKEDSREIRKLARDLRASSDPSILAVLRMLGAEGLEPSGPEAAADTAPLADLLAARAGRLPTDSLAARLLGVDPDSSRFLAPLYWGYADAGLLKRTEGDSLLKARLKSLGEGLQRHDLPFQAAEVFQVCLDLQSEGEDDPELTAWLGSALTKRALFVESSLAKIKMVKEGVKLLDEAAYEHPDFGVVRYIRANTYSALPPVFRKAPMLRSDIEYLLERKASGGTIKIWRDGGHVEETLVNPAQLKQILAKATPLFSEDAAFHSRLETALKTMEN